MAETNVQVDVDALAGGALLQKAIAVGKNKAGMPAGRAFVLALLAGAFIGFGGLFMTIVKADATLSFAASQVLGGLCFSVGLFLVLVAGAELFTGNSLMIIGRLDQKYASGQLLRAWLVVYLGNLAGSLALVALVSMAGIWGLGGGAVGNAMVAVAAGKATLAPQAMLARGILCNMLVCLAVWMGFAGRSVADKCLCALLPVTAFVGMGFEHSVANMFFLPMGLAAKASGFGGEVAAASALTVGSAALNIALVTCGNLVGGVILVGCAYWLAYKK